MRNDHREDNRHEYEARALKLELCKSVCNKTANEGLDKRGGSGKKECISECREVFILKENELVHIDREILGDKHDRYVNEVISTHEGTCDLCKEGVKYDVGNTEKQDESDDIPNHTADESHVNELRLESFLKRGTLKFNSDLILCLLSDLRSACLLCVH